MNQLLIEQIDAILPQTQCRKCSFTGCRPYAEAIAEGRADINQCPPGGQQGVEKIAKLLNVPTKPLDTAYGYSRSGQVVAWIDEHLCIGCTFCLQACPVDAIVGAAKQMHTVIAGECTGCDLCVTPCPMDCILMIPVDKKITNPTGLPADTDIVKRQAAERARSRFHFRQQRLAHGKQAANKAHTGKSIQSPQDAQVSAEMRKQAIVAAALKRAAAIHVQAAGRSNSRKIP